MDSFLDKFFRWLRFRKVIKQIPKDSIVCDIGCGPSAYFLKSISSLIKQGIGLDRELKDYQDSKLSLKRVEIFKGIPFKDKSFDVVTMIAVLEHLTNPQEILSESFRVLKDDGRLILTTPTPLAKPILEILAYKLRLINKNDIKEHKDYFWPKDVKKMLSGSGFKEGNIKTYFFALYFNSLIVAQK